MNKRNDFALAPSPTSAVGQTGTGAKHIQSVIVADTLVLANKQPPTPFAAKFQIGDYKWCEPDYQQILIWAEHAKRKPAEVVEWLAYSKSTFHEGRLLEIHWDDTRMRVQRFHFVAGLNIRVFHVLGGSRTEAIINMHRNPALRRPDFEVLAMNLDGLSQLEVLAVPSQSLKELDLRPAPKLKRLYCEANELSQIDLSVCESLQELRLRANCLTELNLLNLPLLRSLECHQNEISFLELTGTTALEELDCRDNQIEVLDITPLMNLKSLKYDAGKTQLVQRPDQKF